VGFWKNSLVYFGVIDDEEQFDPLPFEMVDVTTVRTIPSPVSPRSANPKGVCVMEPHEFAEAWAIGDRLKERSPIIVNLRHIDLDMAARLVDFACGLSYMSGGRVKKIGGRILLLTPPDVDVSVAEARELISRH